MQLHCTVNGEPREADGVWEGESLLYVLRERLGLPGSKNACEQGECGSCSVYLDRTLVCACLVAAGAVQCGFCTPGLIMATYDLLRRIPAPTDVAIREALAGNLCRCTGYEKILDAVRMAAANAGVGE
ncbi:MAG TPA: 2Fe-2S iron-sulfur cluster-binding protein [Kineosporiaceae bacterium]|nr:2Fe-2S iron-sulfur cluster-binding protein [Kineosporiaceae bacterium]